MTQSLAAIVASLSRGEFRALGLGIGLGVLFVVIGLKGFSENGLPFSPERNITGRTAKIIGGICIGFGVALAVATLVLFLSAGPVAPRR